MLCIRHQYGCASGAHCIMGSHNFKGIARGVYNEDHGKHVANEVYWGFSPYIRHLI